MFILHKLDLDQIISNIEMILHYVFVKNNFVFAVRIHQSLHNFCELPNNVADIFVGKEYNTQVWMSKFG